MCPSAFEAPPDRGAASTYRYFVYGMTLNSETPPALPERENGELGQIEVRLGTGLVFSQLRAPPIPTTGVRLLLSVEVPAGRLHRRTLRGSE